MVQKTLNNEYLSKKLDSVSNLGFLNQYKKIPLFIKENLNPDFPLRPYQVESFARFFYYFESYPEKQMPIHLLFNMATGSGKTLIMAGLILYLYEKGYRNFLFFVNSTNIIEKTKDNFLNSLSNKYLFNNKIIFNNKEVKINTVDNFEDSNAQEINICFTTIQKLHSDLYIQKENSLTFEDFKDKKIVLISDESHHGQVQTKQRTLDLKDEKPNWENTVLNVFNKNKENLLLEFTATIDLNHKEIEQKYRDKIIYKYDLKEFRKDKYSKDIEILRSDTDKKGRILLALILNQYRQDVASKHGIDLKPVILFKAQRTIEQSKENKRLFQEIIENLLKKELEEIKHKTNVDEIKRAFEFYEKENIKIEMLVQRLKINFAENKCLSVNEESEKENYQLLLNSLEDKNNKIRAIFAVQKLNEGWDVLNLYDIVRVYESQAAGGSTKGGISPSTISEAQLIGRGARYCPFKLRTQSYERYKRKFDEDLDHELRILEELHFHSFNESRYIAELNNALVNEGLIDDKTEEKELKLKDSFKKTKFYKEGIIYLNHQIKNNYSYVKSLSDLGVKEKDFRYDIFSFQGKVSHALTEEKYDNLNLKKEPKTYAINEIEKHIILNVLAKKEFFKFENLKTYFPELKSIKDFIEKKEYLSDIKITFWGAKQDILNLKNKDKFFGALKVLDEIELKLKGNLIDYRGSEIFASNKISEIFQNKKIRVEINSPRSEGQEEFLKNKEWYVFNANYGTSEEKACVELINRLVEENFKEKYEEIYLIRNELHFKIYDFNTGQPFSPDFVLFMKEIGGKYLTYQLFIEPKGKHLEKTDEWKEQFLLKIKESHKLKESVKLVETPKYRVIGLPFYNQSDENNFKENLLGNLNVL